MALAGTLKDFSLADIFQLIGLQKKTGVLTLTNEEEEARILFMNGMVVGADTNSQRLEDRLGHVLVKSNRISDDELKMALANQSNTLQRLGQVLVQKGFIKPEDLRDSLRTQTTQIIYRLFRWVDGSYHFQQERFVDYDQENFEPISSESILMEGVRMLDEWPMIEKVIPSFDVVVERTEEGKEIKLNVEKRFSVDASPEDSFNSLLEGMMAESSISEETAPAKTAGNLSHEQEQVLRLIISPSIVQDLIDTSGMNEFETCRALYDLINLGLVQRVREEEVGENIRVVEKETSIPLWVPITLISGLALFSTVLSWNPINIFFATPQGFAKNAVGYSQETAYRLDRVCEAIDIYYYTLGRLPVSLDRLVSQGILREHDIFDPLGRPIVYRPDQGNGSYQVSASGRTTGGASLNRNGRDLSRNRNLLLGTTAY